MKIIFATRIIAVGLIIMIPTMIFAANDNPTSWPEVQPLEKNYYFSCPYNISHWATIFSTKGEPLYFIECHLGIYESPDFDYTGDFECRLRTVSIDKFTHILRGFPIPYSTLLTENLNQSRDWDSRGRFFIEQLTGKSAVNPLYGRVRRFRLRGMDLTLEIKSVRASSGLTDGSDQKLNCYSRIAGLDLRVAVVPDPSANSIIAEPTKQRDY